MTEVWRPIPAAPNYEASDAGRIRRCKPGKRTYVGSIMRPKTEANGYIRVCLHHEGKKQSASVHRLVCSAFHGAAPSSIHEVAHHNGDKSDNRAVNLRWATRKENHADKPRHGTNYQGSRNHKSRLVESQIPTIRGALADGEDRGAIADRFGVSRSTINLIALGRIWKHVA